MIITSALGIVWMYICAKGAFNDLVSRWRNKEGVVSIIKSPSVAAQDLALSAVFILMGTTLLSGVSGMMIGLVASVMVSLIIRITSWSVVRNFKAIVTGA